MLGLGHHEVLQMILGTRAPAALARTLLEQAGGLAAMSRSSIAELEAIPGVSRARAERLVAAFELGRRALEIRERRMTVSSPEHVHRLLGPRVAGLVQECFFVVGLDVRSQLLDVVEVARGSVAGVEIHPREVFRPLLRMAAAAAVVAHNHPSGDPTPSTEDLALTERLRETGRLLGVPIIDHVVLGASAYRSIAEHEGRS